MATTIKLKNGSGAPLAGDLVAGEPALDLTNKRLYTEDAGGTVIEVGTNPTSLTTGTFTSTGIDDNATSTAITIDSSQRVGIGTSSPFGELSIKSASPQVYLETVANGNVQINFNETADQLDVMVNNSNGKIAFGTNSTERMRIDSAGNVGIGTASPNSYANYTTLTLRGTTGSEVDFENSSGTVVGAIYNTATNLTIASDFTNAVADSNIVFTCDGSERMRIDSSGNVGIGGSISTAKLYVVGATNDSTQLALRAQNLATSDLFFVRNDGSMVAGIGSKMTLDASGNLGIGTTSPATFNAAQCNNLVVGTGSGSEGITVYSGTTSQGGLAFADGTSASDQYRGLIQYDHNSNGMLFWTNTSERMRIDASGNVGIGTSSPSFILGTGLHIDSTGYTSIVLQKGGAGQGHNIDFTDESNTLQYRIGTNFASGGQNLLFAYGSTPTIGMTLDSSGNVGIGTTPSSWSAAFDAIDLGPYASFSADNDTTFVTNNAYYNGTNWIYKNSNLAGRYRQQQGFHVWDTAASGTAGGTLTWSEAMRIDSSGNLLVGTTTSVGGGSEGIELRGDAGYYKTARYTAGSAGHWLLYNSNGNVGSVTTYSNSTQFNTSSDQRLKENIVDAPAGNIDAIRVRSFDWKTDGSHQKYGMVAQELVDVAPEAVTQGETDDDMWQVDYSKLVPMMIKEIQDLKAEVAALKGA